jgi:hypothetical protein
VRAACRGDEQPARSELRAASAALPAPRRCAPTFQPSCRALTHILASACDAVLAMDSSKVSVLDIRYPTLPVAELRRHQVGNEARRACRRRSRCRGGLCQHACGPVPAWVGASLPGKPPCFLAAQHTSACP